MLHRPITTYNLQGTAKSGVNPAHHAIAHTGQDPGRTEHERRQRPMRSSIRVQQDDPRTALDPRSRLNYARIYTVEHNVKVRAFGWIHPSSRHNFDIDRTAVYRSIDLIPQANVPGQDEDATEEEDDDDESSDDNSSDNDENSIAGSHDGST